MLNFAFVDVFFVRYHAASDATSGYSHTDGGEDEGQLAAI
jgi:hypothetical protein